MASTSKVSTMPSRTRRASAPTGWPAASACVRISVSGTAQSRGRSATGLRSMLKPIHSAMRRPARSTVKPEAASPSTTMR
jgi:hypothetical protein